MAKIEKLKKDVEGVATTVYPVTIPQAVIDPTSGKSVRAELDEVDDNLAQLAGELDGKTNLLAQKLRIKRLSDNFDGFTYDPDDVYIKMLSSIVSIELKGNFNKENYAIRFLYRNHETYGYRIFIAEIDNDGNFIKIAYDSGTVNITEDPSGYTKIEYPEIDGKSVVVVVDYTDYVGISSWPSKYIPIKRDLTERVSDSFYPTAFGLNQTSTGLHYLNSIKDIILLGRWDKTKIYSLRAINRNHSTNGYRLMIQEMDVSGNIIDATAYDSGYVSLTEGEKYTSFLFPEVNGRQISAIIDYSLLNVGSNSFVPNPVNYAISPSTIRSENSSEMKSRFYSNFYNSDYDPDDVYIKMLSSIVSIKLIGDFARGRNYAVRFLYRNHETYGYRIFIAEIDNDGNFIKIAYDSGTVNITEDPHGYTKIEYPEIDKRKVELIIDYTDYVGISSWPSKYIPIREENIIYLPESIKGDSRKFRYLDFVAEANAAESINLNFNNPVSNKKGFIVWRLDDKLLPKSIKETKSFLAILEKFNAKCTNATVSARAYSQKFVNNAFEFERRGHLLADHTPNHTCDYFEIPPGYRDVFEPYVGNGIDRIITYPDKLDVAILTREHIYDNLIDLKIGTDNGYTIEAGTGKITGDFSMLDRNSNNTLWYYLYIDNANGEKIGWVPIRYMTEGSIIGYKYEYCIWDNSQVEVCNPDFSPISFDSTETITLYAQKFGVNNVTLPENSAYVLFLAGQIWFHFLGLQKPQVWIQPGGFFAQLHNTTVEKIINKFGMLWADTQDAPAKFITYCENRVNKHSQFWWHGGVLHFDDCDGIIEPVKIEIAEAVAKKQIKSIGSHLYYANFPGETSPDKLENFYKFYHDLMQWSYENDIAFLRYDEMARTLVKMEADRKANIIPNLYTDAAKQSKPDGYSLGAGVVLDKTSGRPEDKQHSLKLSGNGTIFSITDLGAVEKGENEFEMWAKGSAGAVITVSFGTIGDAVFTIDGTGGWEKFKLSDSTGITMIDVPFDMNYIAISAVSSNNEGNDIAISGMKLRGA